MVVEYVPINPENKYLTRKQRLYVDKLIIEGWKRLGNIVVKDTMGTEIEVAVLKNDDITLEEQEILMEM